MTPVPGAGEARGDRALLLAERLDAFRGEGAESVILVSESGSLRGESGITLEDATSLGSLAPAHLAACLRLATLLGAVDLSAVALQGSAKTVLLRRAGQGWSLVEVHPGVRAPRSIVARSEGLAMELEGFLETVEPEQLRETTDLGRWTEEAESEIDRIFGGEG